MHNDTVCQEPLVKLTLDYFDSAPLVHGMVERSDLLFYITPQKNQWLNAEQKYGAIFITGC